MLPFELLALVLLASNVIAIPQGSLIAENGTDTSVPERPAQSREKVHAESTADGWGDATQPGIPPAFTVDCGTADNCGILTVHPESTMSGWEVTITDGVLKKTMVEIGTSSIDRVLIATSTPTLIGVHTEVRPSVQPGVAKPGGAPNSAPISAEDHPAPASSLAAPTSEPLLLDIISHLAPSLPSQGGSNFSPNSAPTPAAGNSANPEHDTNKSSPPPNVTPSPAVTAPPSAPITTAGSEITLGSSVLTLTPGLSSTIGEGDTATYVAIATDGNGQTLITVSSSGTAVTATITNAPATITKLRTQYESSITTAARAGTVDGNNLSNRATMTSSKGAAASQKVELGQWWHVGMGIAGFGLVMG